MERIPDSLLKGKFFHCRPVHSGSIVKTQLIPFEPFEGETEPSTFKVAIMCPARRPSSKCALRIEANNKDKRCHYYRGDSRGVYQIIGPGMDKKSDRGYTS